MTGHMRELIAEMQSSSWKTLHSSPHEGGASRAVCRYPCRDRNTWSWLGAIKISIGAQPLISHITDTVPEDTVLEFKNYYTLMDYRNE